MGLTIHYTLRADTTVPAKARQLVKQLYQRASDIPFQSVGEVVEYHGRDADFNQRANYDSDRWLLIHACQYVHVHPYPIPPRHLIAFSTDPGDGSEKAFFGLARYPDIIDTGNGDRISTGLAGWSWHSACMTQYSNAPAFGGTKNFLRAHLSIVQLLDEANGLGILGDVQDEGGYWTARKTDLLIREVGEWSKQHAGFIGDMIRYTGLDFSAQ